MPVELDRQFTIYEKNNINSGETEKEKDAESTIGSRVGICYNLLRSFLPTKENIFTKIQFEEHLHDKISKDPLCKDFVANSLKPFSKGVSYTYRQTIDKCETAKIVATYIAYGSTSTYAQNWNTLKESDPNQKNNEAENMSNQYVKDIIEKSEDINTECRKILTNGFFHVYGIQIGVLEKKMVEKINEIEKNMETFSIDKSIETKIKDL
jgi:tetrahydromethanopterin S-methyltransferase subunit H